MCNNTIFSQVPKSHYLLFILHFSIKHRVTLLSVDYVSVYVIVKRVDVSSSLLTTAGW